ncbi:MAG: trypsin-like peptidase domain-containing protein [Chloroflexi bacterium]|nr:trypsin-like peptidase domain-containing protein [Chloroflexota bacterium]
MSDMLKQVSDEMAQMVESAGQSVVRIEARRRLPASGVVWSADGLIVTSHHIVERDDNIQIGLANGQNVTATLVGRDPNTDIAVLRAKDAALTVPNWAGADDLRVGHLVLALGRPGQYIQATLGVVSALGSDITEESGIEDVLIMRNMPFDAPPMAPGGFPFPPMARRSLERAQERAKRATEQSRERAERRARRWAERSGSWGGRFEQFVQTDVAMYPGFSGGPLVDAGGQIRGINSSAIMRGVSLTVPTPVVRRVVEALLSHGRVRQGFLGIGAQPARLTSALAEQFKQETGLLLVSVEVGSPADKSGLMVGDVLLALDGVMVRTLDELLALLSGNRVGAEVPVLVLRGGQAQEVLVTVGERK